VEFTEVLKRRRMIRAFTTEPLPEGLTDRLLAAAARAPSAGFSQGFSFLVLEGAEQRPRSGRSSSRRRRRTPTSACTAWSRG
jgi:nitroreductase